MADEAEVDFEVDDYSSINNGGGAHQERGEQQDEWVAIDDQKDNDASSSSHHYNRQHDRDSNRSYHPSTASTTGASSHFQTYTKTREPVPVSKALFVSRFGHEIQEDDIRKCFSHYGTVTIIYIRKDNYGNQIAYVNFETIKEASAAKYALHKQPGLGCDSLIVDFKKDPPRPSNGDDYDSRDSFSYQGRPTSSQPHRYQNYERRDDNYHSYEQHGGRRSERYAEDNGRGGGGYRGGDDRGAPYPVDRSYDERDDRAPAPSALVAPLRSSRPRHAAAPRDDYPPSSYSSYPGDERDYADAPPPSSRGGSSNNRAPPPAIDDGRRQQPPPPPYLPAAASKRYEDSRSRAEEEPPGRRDADYSYSGGPPPRVPYQGAGGRPVEAAYSSRDRGRDDPPPLYERREGYRAPPPAAGDAPAYDERGRGGGGGSASVGRQQYVPRGAADLVYVRSQQPPPPPPQPAAATAYVRHDNRNQPAPYDRAPAMKRVRDEDFLPASYAAAARPVYNRYPTEGGGSGRGRGGSGRGGGRGY